MSRSAIPGFVKKRSAAQQYRRSPRQITRDITIALEMRDESILSHLQIRTEDGGLIEGNDITPELIKQLRAEGRNPMWYLRKTWLEESYGLRGDDTPDREQVAEGTTSENDDEDQSRTMGKEGIVELMQESIRELKKDKEVLTAQLKIKDQQILETTRRWKESNYISQGLNQRLETMEKRFELNSQLLQSSIGKIPRSEPESPVDISTIQMPIEPKPKKSEARQRQPRKIRKKAVHKSTGRSEPVKAASTNPKWYEMPTLKKFLSRSK